jgi:hypothetical protein
MSGSRQRQLTEEILSSLSVFMKLGCCCETSNSDFTAVIHNALRFFFKFHTLFKVSQEGISKSKVERERARKREIFFPPS